MIISKKIRLLPTNEQEIMFRKSAGVARWAYNYYIATCEKNYKDYQNGLRDIPHTNEGEVRKYINNTLKKTTHTWLSEVSSNVMKQAVINADVSYKRYFQKLSNKPKFKSKHKSKPSFYVNYESLKRIPNGFQGEKIGKIKTSEPLPKLKQGGKYKNPYISFDGRNWYLSVSYDIDTIFTELTDVSLGVDVGIKDLAICSNGKVYKNINKTQKVKHLKRKLKRENRKLSKKLLENTKSYAKNRKPIYKKPLKECKNIQKQRKIISDLHKKITDIRNNHLHQTTNDIVKTKPYRIVVEDLNVRGMMKNKHLSKAIAEQKLTTLLYQLEYKSKKYNIDFIKANRFYPSSKTCSCCGTIKKDLRLSDRVFHCECGFTLDRDLNASMNLSNYRTAN